MMEDYWLSRRPDCSTAEIFSMAQQELMNYCINPALELLAVAAHRGHLESKWLFGHLQDRQSFIVNALTTHKSGAEFYFGGSDHPIAVKYRLALFDPRDIDEIEETKLLAESGDAVAQYTMGKCYRKCPGNDSRLKEISWYQKAADQNFPPAISALTILLRPKDKESIKDNHEHIQKLLRAAAFGCRQAGNQLVNCLMYLTAGQRKQACEIHAISDAEMAAIEAILFLRAKIDVAEKVLSRLRWSFIVLDGLDDTNEALKQIFIVGQIFDKYSQYSDRFYEELQEPSQTAMVVYRQMIGKARQASIQTILCLRFNRLTVKDIAIVIAKLVYATRMDAVWYAES